MGKIVRTAGRVTNARLVSSPLPRDLGGGELAFALDMLEIELTHYSGEVETLVIPKDVPIAMGAVKVAPSTVVLDILPTGRPVSASVDVEDGRPVRVSLS